MDVSVPAVVRRPRRALDPAPSTGASMDASPRTNVPRRAALVAAAALLAAPALAASQTSALPTEGDAAITAEDLRRQVGVLAHDSMRGRPTPSPELVEVAEYIADRFESYGLRPGLPDGSYLQWYPITVVRPASGAAPTARVSGPGGDTRLRQGADFVATPSGPATSAEGALRLWRPGDGEVPPDGVLLAPITSGSISGALGSVREALATGADGAALVLDMSTGFFRRLDRYFQEEQVNLGEPAAIDEPVVLVRKGALPAGLADALDRGRIPEGWSASLTTSATVVGEEAPNAVGWIRGSDPELRDEYVLYSAHMDHLGIGRAVDGDSIYNGADDDASGTATILELAQAFAAGEPPRRSVVFLAVSGEERGLLGSQWYAENPVFPLDRTVAAINMDMIGRNWRDTVAAVGMEASTLGATAREVAADHPELGMTVVGDRWPEENLFVRSDHYHFARNDVPAIFFFSGLHEDYHGPDDEVEKLDYDKTARIGRLLYLLGRRVADAGERPEWDREVHRDLFGSGGER